MRNESLPLIRREWVPRLGIFRYEVNEQPRKVWTGGFIGKTNHWYAAAAHCRKLNLAEMEANATRSQT